MGRALRRIPTWAWLAAIVVGSTIVRAILGRDLVAPFIMVDEIIWSEVARGIADAGEPLLRDEPDPGYSIVYPLLISPVYALFESLPDAYAGVKTLNALLMSLAAVPAFFLARRVVRDGLALLAALMTVAIPSMAYTGTVMTENAFYPLFLLVALVLVLVLERPTLLLVALLLAPRGPRVRDPRAGRRPRAGDPPRALRPRAVRAVERHGHAREVPVAVRDRRRCALSRCSRVQAVVGRRPARRLRARRRAVVRARRGASIPVVARRRALSLPARDPARGDDRPRRARALARCAAPGVPRSDGLPDGVRRPGRRLSRRSSPTGSRSGTCSTSRRFSASRSSHGSSVARRVRVVLAVRRCCRLRAPRGRDPARAVHHHLGAHRHADAAAVLVSPGQDRCGLDGGRGARARRRARRCVPLRAPALRARAAAARARHLDPRDQADLVGDARVRAVLARSAVPGHPHRRSRLGRPRAAGGSGRRISLDRAHRSAHGEPERVLQSGCRPGLLRHRSDARWVAGETRADRSADGRSDVRGRHAGARPIPPRGLIVRAGRRAAGNRRGVGNHALARAASTCLGGAGRRAVPQRHVVG